LLSYGPKETAMLETIVRDRLAQITGGQDAPKAPTAPAPKVTSEEIDRATRDYVRQMCGPTGDNCHVIDGMLVKGLR